MELFTTTDGRIGRGKWWIGVIIMLVVAIIVQLILAIFLPLPLVSLLVMLLLIYPACCLYLKRLHDRDKGAMPWLAIFMVPGVLYSLAYALGIGFDTIDIGGQAVPAPNALGMVLGAAAFIVGLWALVEMGFLKGTNGANQYGEDPIA